MKALHELVVSDVHLRDGDFISTLYSLPSVQVMDTSRNYPERKRGRATRDLVLKVLSECSEGKIETSEAGTGRWYTIVELADLCDRTISMTRFALKNELLPEGKVSRARSTNKKNLEYLWRLKGVAE